MYPKIVVEHFMNPKNSGKIAKATVVGEASTQSGNTAVIYLLIADDIIKEFKYQVSGCPYAIASASILSEHAKEKNIKEFSNFNVSYFEQFFPLTEESIKCTEVVINAFKDALNKYFATNP